MKRKIEAAVDVLEDEREGPSLKKSASTAEKNANDFRDIKHKNPLPSSSELRAINEAENLYKNNSFKTQLDSLVQSIYPKEKYIPELEKIIHDLYPFFLSLPTIDPIHPLDGADSLLAFRARREQTAVPIAIPYPVPQPTRSTAWNVTFKAPVRLNVVGSWATKTAFKRPEKNWFVVDLAVEMPSDIFQEKDYRNSRFFHKRAFYLACVAAALSYSRFDFGILYESPEDDPRLTNLVLVTRSGNLSKLNAAIRIILVATDDNPIPLRRLLPSQSNMRTSGNSDDQVTANLPSPIYNSALGSVFGSTFRGILLRSHHLLDTVPAVREALALLKVWGNQRGYGSGSYTAPSAASDVNIHRSKYCIHGFERLGAWWICVLNVLLLGEEPSAHTAKKAIRSTLGTGISSYQLFRGALDFLSKHDWEREPVFMRNIKTNLTFDASSWIKIPGPVFVDPTGLVNMLAGVPLSSLQLLARDAEVTLHALDTVDDPFSTVFMTDMREPHTRFDCIIGVKLSQMQCKVPPLSADFPTTFHFLIDLLLSTIKQALGSRAKVVVALHSRSSLRSITSCLPSELDSVTVGIIYDPVSALQLVDHGPSVDAPESQQEAFRAFWGPKADLRRFKDGRILYSCVWDDGVIRTEDRESTPVKIVLYILKLKFGLQTPNGVTILNADYGSVITPPARGSITGRGDCAFTDAMKAYDKFSKELKALEENGGLVLSLVVTKPSSPALRYMSVLPPCPVLVPAMVSSSVGFHPSVSYLSAFRVILQLERSSRWPDDIQAIQRAKMALLEGMARGFMKQDKKYHARVVIPRAAGSGGTNSIAESLPALEVLIDGWAFHAYIWHEREAMLLSETSNVFNRPGFTPASFHERSKAQKSLENYNRFFIYSPQYHSAVLALHHKYPSLSFTIRLVKRWLASHWVGSRVRDEAIELICIGVYLSNTHDIPATARRGFTRVLDFLSRWDGVLYVKLFEEVRDGETQKQDEGNDNVKSIEIQAGQGSWRIATLEDPSGAIWCDTITPLVSSRIKSLAQALMKVISGGSNFSFKSLFVHPTEDYDFLLHLNTDAVTRYWEGIHPSPSVWTSGYVNLDLHDVNKQNSVRVEFNPAEAFYRDLQHTYSDVIEFFYDVYGGTVIGGTWHPDLGTPKQWKVYLGYSSSPIFEDRRNQDKVKNTGLVTLNKEAIMSEIQRIGEGIIKSISYCNK